MRRYSISCLMVMTLAVLSACAHVQTPAVIDGKLQSSWSSISDAKYLRARGFGAPQPKTVGQARRRAQSRQAGLVAARYELLSVVKGVKVSGGLSVADLMLQDSKITESANRIIRGAEEVSCEWTAEDEAVVTIELRRKKIARLIKEDQKWEPPTEREQWEAEMKLAQSRAKTAPARYTYHGSYADGKRPLTALGLGLLVPGLGQLYSGGEDSGVGYYSMAIVGGMASLGVGFLKPHDVGEMRSDGTYRQGTAPLYGYALLTGAAMIHVWAAVDGMNMVRDRGGVFTIEPTNSGVRVGYGRRF